MATDATDTTFDSDVVARSSERAVVVDFWAEWCGPCHALAPVLEAAIEERGDAVELVKVDVDAQQALSDRFGISGIPAVKAFRNGRVVAEFTGVRSRPAVEAFLDELLAPPLADALIDELRASGELADVVAAVDAGDAEGALRTIVEAVPAATADERDRLRQVAVALFELYEADEELVGTYRRRLAAALY